MFLIIISKVTKRKYLYPKEDSESFSNDESKKNKKKSFSKKIEKVIRYLIIV